MAFVKRKEKSPEPATPQSSTVQTILKPKVPRPTDHTPRPEGSSSRLGDQLVGSGLLTQGQLDRALDLQHVEGGLLGEILVAQGALSEQALAHSLAAFLGYDLANLRTDNIDEAAVAFLPEVKARELMAVPIRVVDDVLHIAVAEPSDSLRVELNKLTGRTVSLLLAPLSDVRWAIDSNYQALDSVSQLIQVFESVEVARRRPTQELTTTEIVTDDAPVVQVVDRILIQAMRDRASDVHIEPSEDIVRVRFRIDGALKEVLQMPAAIGPGLVSRIKIMANMNIVERRRPQDGQLTIPIDGIEVDVRVATAATIMGEG